jgi:hydroxymethylglutaryl-CoA lyase
VKIIESPREAMQGIKTFIPTTKKIDYINSTLKVGFDLVETGSFVSPSYIPQMADSLEVLKKLDLSSTSSRLMFLVVNKKGARIVSEYNEISCISYPFSISPTFSKLNLNATFEQTLVAVDSINDICLKTGKEFILYFSMAFGNPYGDYWSIDLLRQWVERFIPMGIKTFPLSNVSVPLDETMISTIFSKIIPQYPGTEFGLHLHTTFNGWHDKVNAAYLAGCRRFDTVMTGIGGCPSSGEEMLGNLDTIKMNEYLMEKKIATSINGQVLMDTYGHVSKLFSEYLN